MDILDDVLALIEYMTETNKRKHIVGGVLLSTSILFASLAFTIFTIKSTEENDYE